MYFNQYPTYDPTKSSTYNFYGLNRTRRTSKGEFADMTNMSTLEYPCAAPCGTKKYVAKAPGLIQAICAPDSTNVDEITGFTGIAGGEFYYNGVLKGFKKGSPNYWEELYTFPLDYSWQIVRKGNMYIFNGYNPDTQCSIMYSYNIDTDTFGDGNTIRRNLIVSIENITYGATAFSDSNSSYYKRFISGKTYDDEKATVIWIGPCAGYSRETSSTGLTSECYDYISYLNTGKVIKNSNFFDKYCKWDTGFDPPYVENNSEFRRFASAFPVGTRIDVDGFPSPDNITNGQLFGTANMGTTNKHDHRARKLIFDDGENDNLHYNNTVNADNLYDLEVIPEDAIVNLEVIGFCWRYADIVDKTALSYGLIVRAYNKNGVVKDMVEISGEKIGFSDKVADFVWCNGITISKHEHSFENVTVHDGRIWGVVPTGDQIYVSASDQIFSWTTDDIVSGFAARIPSDSSGKFNGIVSYSGDVVAFKESSITVISGDNPTNYFSYDINGIGCIDPKSVAVTPSGVIFLSYKGFYIFTGNVPQLISAKLNTKYKSATGGFDGFIYYASAVKDDGKRELVTYDMRYNLWHRRDDMNVTGLFVWRGSNYLTDNVILYKYEDEADDSVEWSFTSVKTHFNTLDLKGVNELWIRCEVGKGAEFTVETRVDDGPWREHATFKNEGMQIFHCPIRVQMGTQYQYRIRGRGMVVFFEIETQSSYGGRFYKEAERTQKAQVNLKSNELKPY